MLKNEEYQVECDVCDKWTKEKNMVNAWVCSKCWNIICKKCGEVCAESKIKLKNCKCKQDKTSRAI